MCVDFVAIAEGVSHFKSQFFLSFRNDPKRASTSNCINCSHLLIARKTYAVKLMFFGTIVGMNWV